MPTTPRNRARRAAAALTCLLAVAASVELAPAAGAQTVDPGSDPVGAALADPSRIDSLAEVGALARATEDDHGVRLGVVTDRNGGAPGGISTTQIVVDRSDVAALDARVSDVPGVLSVEPVRRVSLAADPLGYLQYGPVRTGNRSLAAGLDGSGTTVAVIDTGVMGTHRDLTPPLADGRARVLPGTTFVFGSTDTGTPGTTDVAGHGTHVAGIITAAADNEIGGAGAAPQAQILPIRVFRSATSGAWSSDIAAAIRWAHDRGADVINMSLGAAGTTPADVAAAINFVTTDTSRGKAPTIVVAAAGNEGTRYSSVWPGEHPSVIAVAATDDQDRVTSFSSRGSYVDVAAPGLDILSTCRSGNACYMSGTSMASPLVAAAAAVLRGQEPTRTPAQVQRMLESTATDLGDPGRDTSSGAGLVRVDRAAGSATPVVPPPSPAPVRRVTPPSAPTAMAAQCTATACTVSFTNASDGGATITGHLLLAVPDRLGKAGGLTGGGASPLTVGGLTSDTRYRLTVVSGNRAGLSAATTITARTLPATSTAAARATAVRRAQERSRHAAAVRRAASCRSHPRSSGGSP